MQKLVFLISAIVMGCNSSTPATPTTEPKGNWEIIDDDAEDIGLSLNGLLRLRNEANKKTIDPTIEYLSNLMCGQRDGLGAIDIETFYPMERIAEMMIVTCGRFILKNNDQICGRGPKERKRCFDRYYSKPSPPPLTP